MEPLNPHRSPFGSGWVTGALRVPDSDDQALVALWTGMLNGSLRSEWTDGRNRARIVRRRVVKSISATNLAPWLRQRFPSTPIVYIVRNPLATAQSIRSLYLKEVASGRSADWTHVQGSEVEDMVLRSGLLEGPFLDRADAMVEIWRNAEGAFERSVFRWCLENGLSLTASEESGFLLVRYEQFVSDPDRHIAEIAAFTDLDLSSSLAAFVDGSSTDFNAPRSGAYSADERVRGWRAQVSDQELSTALEESCGYLDLRITHNCPEFRSTDGREMFKTCISSQVLDFEFNGRGSRLNPPSLRQGP